MKEIKYNVKLIIGIAFIQWIASLVGFFSSNAIFTNFTIFLAPCLAGIATRVLILVKKELK